MKDKDTMLKKCMEPARARARVMDLEMHALRESTVCTTFPIGECSTPYTEEQCAAMLQVRKAFEEHFALLVNEEAYFVYNSKMYEYYENKMEKLLSRLITSKDNGKDCNDSMSRYNELNMRLEALKKEYEEARKVDMDVGQFDILSKIHITTDELEKLKALVSDFKGFPPQCQKFIEFLGPALRRDLDKAAMEPDRTTRHEKFPEVTLMVPALVHLYQMEKAKREEEVLSEESLSILGEIRTLFEEESPNLHASLHCEPTENPGNHLEMMEDIQMEMKDIEMKMGIKGFQPWWWSWRKEEIREKMDAFRKVRAWFDSAMDFAGYPDTKICVTEEFKDNDAAPHPLCREDDQLIMNDSTKNTPVNTRKRAASGCFDDTYDLYPGWMPRKRIFGKMSYADAAALERGEGNK